MKRMKVIASLALAATMLFGLVGCGGGADKAASSDSTDSAAATQEVSDEGKVLNIYCWNEEFKNRVTDHYSDYTETGSDLAEDDNGDVAGTVEGKIGDVKVVWHITPSKDNAYQNNLDEALLNQADASDDDKVDLFLVEADYALKYVDTDATMSVEDLGITDEDTKNQYQYTKDVMTDSNGVLKGLSWQGCPAALIYNRDVAKEVLGTEEPDEVQEYVKDWDTYRETAKKMKDAGYYMTATANDSYRVFSNNVTTPWVDADKNIQIDDNIATWVEMSKEMVDAKETTSEAMWEDQWKTGFYPEGKVFNYFGPAWLFNFSMGADDEGSVANSGRWGLCVGPQSFFWGGTWICGATGTDNAGLVGDIMKTMTCDETVLTEIVNDDDDFANNSVVMENFANDESYQSEILGGQNPNKIFCEGVKNIDLSNISSYDQGCNEKFQEAMKNYFDGNASYEEALEQFYDKVEATYPALSH
ncbi:MAG: ABC transporter substrate-binding protein [Lachnospiraceae bacterium]|nr:ABC transporter substrate-binding protein [Lachnospiraceae bacterium]